MRASPPCGEARPRFRPDDDRTTGRRADETTRSRLQTLRGSEARLLVVPSSCRLVVLQGRALSHCAVCIVHCAFCIVHFAFCIVHCTWPRPTSSIASFRCSSAHRGEPAPALASARLSPRCSLALLFVLVRQGPDQAETAVVVPVRRGVVASNVRGAFSPCVVTAAAAPHPRQP